MAFFRDRKQEDGAPSETMRPTLSHQPLGFETVLGANAKLEGKLESKGNVRLDGSFKGTLEITGNILVGETARIEADINARNISIAGAVRGNVTGKKVQLLRTGRIWGDITAHALTTEEGAFIDGKITMTGRDMNTGLPSFDEEEQEEQVATTADTQELEVTEDETQAEEETESAEDATEES